MGGGPGAAHPHRRAADREVRAAARGTPTSRSMRGGLILVTVATSRARPSPSLRVSPQVGIEPLG
jgi:hypothetical protein